MSLDREIIVRVATNHGKFSDLFIDFVTNFWVDNNEFGLSSLDQQDIEDFNYKDFKNFNLLKPILDNREKKGVANYLSFWVNKCDETILISSIKKKELYEGNSSHYELTFTPGIGKRINKADRYTDYGFYLNQIIPRLLEIGCYVCEIKCRDYDC